MINWLHISDLHIVLRADWINFQKELIAKCIKEKINFVIVTGDFHNYKDGDDFHIAKEFLERLMEELGLDINKDLFIVPGNHDGTTNIEDAELYITTAKAKPLELKKEWLNNLLGMFNGYEQFVKELIPNYPSKRPAGIHSRMWNNQINFIHCNTAIIADGSQKENQLLDIDGFSNANFIEGMPNIILAHNSFYELNEEVQKRIRDIIRNNSIHAYLCGDRHIEEVTGIQYGISETDNIPCVVSYKSAPEAIDDYSSFGFIIGKWENKVANLYGWTWKSGEGFSIDAKITNSYIDMGIKANCHELFNEQVRKSNIEEINKYSDCILEDKVENREYNISQIKNDFIRYYYSMTPEQLKKYNSYYKSKEMEIIQGISPRKLAEYINKAEERCLLKEMFEYMRCLF